MFLAGYGAAQALPAAEGRSGQAQSVAGQEDTGFLVTGETVGQLVEGRRVIGMLQVGQFVHKHSVEHPPRHRAQAVGQPDLPGVERAGSPARRLVGHPAHRGRPDAQPVAVAEDLGPCGQVVVAHRGAQRILGHQAVDQPGDRGLPLFAPEVGRE